MMNDSARKRSLRKIAILIQTLAESEADRLLEQMSLDQAADVREMAESLQGVSETERAEVINDFLRATGRASLNQENAGVELQLSSAAKSRQAIDKSRPHPRTPGLDDEAASEMDGQERATRSPRYETRTAEMVGVQRESAKAELNDRTLGFIQPQHAPSVAQWMIGERESVGIAVLALLPPVIAARVLEQLPLERQRTMLVGLSELRRVEPEVVNELKRILELVVADAPTSGDLHAGHAAVQAILQQVQEAHRHRLMTDSRALPQAPQPNTVDRANSNPSEHSMNLPVNSSVARGVVGRGATASRPNHTVANELQSRNHGPSTRSAATQGEASSAKSLRILPESRTEPQSRSAADDSSKDRSFVKEAEGVAESAGSRTPSPLIGSPAQQRLIAERFEELSSWSEGELIQLFKLIPPRMARVALIGTSTGLITKVLRPLQRDEAARWREMIERPGAIRISDIAAAQLAILKIAQQQLVS